jgi:tRNA A-37 threonylcarbamoyl transferase component Bud32
MESAINGTPAIFNEALMKRTFEECLLPFCGGSTVIQRCRRLWSKYQPLEGTLQAVYQVDFVDPKKSQHFSRRLYLVIPGESRMAPGMPEKGEPEEGESSGESNLPVSYLYLPPLNMLIQVFPTDMRLPQLRTLVNPKVIVLYLQAYIGLNKTEIPRITVLKYKPEKRCVIRYDLSGHVEKPPSIREYSLIGKTFGNDRGREIFHVMRFLKRSGLPVPEPFSYIPELKLLLIEALCGRELGSFVREPSFPVYVQEAARAVAELHRVTVDPKIVETVSLEEEADSFTSLVERFQLECPPLKKKIDSLASTILRKLKDCSSEHLTFVHGELDPSQLMVSDSKIWFVDFDLFKISHPATDIGRFLAYLNRLSLKLYGDPTRLGTIGNLFLEEYLSLCPDDLRTQILICQAMECVKISFIQFRRQASDWKFRLASMWETAEKALSSV